MPELPEVETVRAGLAGSLTGATVNEIEIFDDRSLRRHIGGLNNFVETLTGRRILAVVRRGKFLWMPLDAGAGDPPGHQLALVGHLGMSGQMLLRTPGFEADKLTRVVMRCTQADGSPIEFRFIDQRLFGGLQIDFMVATADGHAGGFSAGVGADQPWQHLIPSVAAHIARDPLDDAFDEVAVINRLRRKNTGIKRALLDQGLVSGIGNIYADETLWQTKLHYDQSASTLSKAKAREVMAVVRDILVRAVAQGGTSFDEQYKNVNGESGYFEVSLNAYGQTGKPCTRCGAAIKREEWANRGSHFCPKCQRIRAKV